MRILHTSDWHLGISTGPASRHAEQEAFLTWLLEQLQVLEVDALIVAGDVFDSMHPSSEAQELYYRFLARVASTGVRDVVIVGGNHDSPARLDAPRALLEAVQVHVVGGIPPSDERHARMLAPLRARGSDDVAAVCLAVPYIHEYRLGIRTSDLDRDKTREAFKAAFAALYTDLADAAEAQYPGSRLIATGHLTMGLEAKSDDYPQKIHQVGTIEALPAGLLDPRIRYTALGHIHRCYPIKDSTAWYSGSPIPYALKEMASKRRVLLVELDGDTDGEDGKPTVRQIEVPRRRDLVQLTGTLDEVLSQLAGLRWDAQEDGEEQFAPLVHVKVVTETAQPGLQRRLHEVVEAYEGPERPVLVEVRQVAPEVESPAGLAVAPSLETREPSDVFGLMCDARQVSGPTRAALESAFGVIEAATDEVLRGMIDDIELPPSANSQAGGST
jgi:exonuclease SbcD